MISLLSNISEKIIGRRVSEETIKVFIKFSVVGISGILVNQGTLFILVSLTGMNVGVAGILSIELSIITNFLLNNYWTWDHTKIDSFLSRLAKYHLVTLVSGGTNYVVLLVLTNYSVHYLIANMIGILIGMSINFLFNHLWTFNKQSETKQPIQNGNSEENPKIK